MSPHDSQQSQHGLVPSQAPSGDTLDIYNPAPGAVKNVNEALVKDWQECNWHLKQLEHARQSLGVENEKLRGHAQELASQTFRLEETINALNNRCIDLQVEHLHYRIKNRNPLQKIWDRIAMCFGKEPKEIEELRRLGRG